MPISKEFLKANKSGKKIVRLSQNAMLDAVLHQPISKMVVKSLQKVLNVAGRKSRSAYDELKEGIGQRAGFYGTFYKNKAGKKVVALDRKKWEKSPRHIKRLILAHEITHTKPIIGSSEIIAHIAGGLASKKPFIHKHGVGGQIKNFVENYPYPRVFAESLATGAAAGMSVGVPIKTVKYLKSKVNNNARNKEKETTYKKP